MFQVGQKIKTCADLYYEKQMINKISQIITIEIFFSCIQHNFGLFRIILTHHLVTGVYVCAFVTKLQFLHIFVVMQ